MKYLHLRNATALLSLGRERFLVDPMLGDVGSMMGFKLFGGRRNPIAPLPAVALDATAAILTHDHPDHLDRAGLAHLRERGLAVWTSRDAMRGLAKKGLDARDVAGLGAETIRGRHGTGLMAWAMGTVNGFFLAVPGEPSVYLVGDSILTDSVMDAVTRLQPDVIVAPAGSANVGIGGDILFSVDELVALAKAARGQLILNHLEALDHCPTTREALRARMDAEGVRARVHIPADGETLSFGATKDERM